MKRFLGATLFGFSLLASVPAFAKASYPMKAAEFQKHVDARIARARTQLEEHIKKQGMNEEKAKAARARLDERIAKIEAAAKIAEADGTVTAEEAQTVRDAGRRHKR